GLPANTTISAAAAAATTPTLPVMIADPCLTGGNRTSAGEKFKTVLANRAFCVKPSHGGEGGCLRSRRDARRYRARPVARHQPHPDLARAATAQPRCCPQ